MGNIFGKEFHKNISTSTENIIRSTENNRLGMEMNSPFQPCSKEEEEKQILGIKNIFFFSSLV